MTDQTTTAPAYTDDEVERATALFIENQLEPAAKRTGRPLGDLMNQVSDDLFGAWVLVYMMAGRAADRGEITPDRVVSHASVLFVGALRKLPGREATAAAVVSAIYHGARAAAGVEDDQYAADRAVVEADMRAAQLLPFDAYAGFLAQYGTKLRQLAEKHSAPEAAYLVLRDHADAVLAQLNGDDDQ
ncbi:hypothetical protein ACWCXH_33645 [Kitasatospora sp. NPDC001660]